ncbi:LADA_0E05072g1_1 [Lachancea dasiensis]|uniref:LADA_0E05072g1_1 n=1 Tax=Lachancea dasiensis TaxID=1072105 RepID=A0A1G4JBZ7_9SACH|nr:LADA_0E05072g1_1 [Lachancea dasiensis]
MRVQKPIRNILKKPRCTSNLRKLHSAPDHPRQGVLVDERFGDLLPQQTTGVYFLLEVHTQEPGLTPHEIVEVADTEPPAMGMPDEAVELEEVFAVREEPHNYNHNYDSDVDMQDG